MVVYRKKKENCYIKCKECKKIFCTEEYDMASYKYRDKLGGRYIYFCSYNCMMRYKREKGSIKTKSQKKSTKLKMLSCKTKGRMCLESILPVGYSFK